MPSFQFVQTDNYEPLQSEADDLFLEISGQISSFYTTLKEVVLTGNEKAILLHGLIRNKSADGRSFASKFKYCDKIFKNASTISEFTKLIKQLKNVLKMARDYTRCFNQEIAIEGSGIIPIAVKTEEEAALPVLPQFRYSPDGFEALDKFQELSLPVNLLPKNLTPEDIAEAETDAKTTIQKSYDMVSDGPSYARYDMKSYDILCLVKRQDKIRRLLNKPVDSIEDHNNLSQEFHYNNEVIHWMVNYEPPYEAHADDYNGYSSDDSHESY